MGRPYTCGVWTVRAGREADFIERWRELAGWAAETFPSAGKPTLLKDHDQPNRFISFGSWDSLEAIDEFRGHAGFAERVGRLRELLDDFQPMTLEAIVEPSA
jgi:heme-degrading monooxygenase HmoA